jgi:uncharacterized protein (DUF2237 family)
MMGGAQVQMQGGNAATMPALSPAEEADLDAALIETYAKAGITNDPLTHGSTPPTIATFTTRCCTWAAPDRSWHSACANTPAALLPEFSRSRAMLMSITHGSV